MIDGLSPYPEYKDSGLPWLGDIPAHWEVRRNGRLFRQRNETGFPDLPILEVSLKTGVRIRDFENSTRKQVMSDREKYKRARQGDIAYNMMRMWQGAVGVAPVDGLISPAYIVAQPLPETDARYYENLFRIGDYKNEINKFSRGIVSDRNRLYWEDFKQIPSPFPPPEEQAAIVRFLEHVDRRIRRYVRAKRQLIALLNEQRQAIIHHAVTRGVDSNVGLTPSGVDWLGNVPSHWEVKKLRTLVDVKGGMTPSKSEPSFWNGTIPWVSPKDMKFAEISDSIDHITNLAVKASNIQVVKPPAVLIVVRGMILARTIPIGVTSVPVTINQDMKALLPRPIIDASFLRLALIGASRHIQSLVEESGHGTRVLRTELWRDVVLPVPPRDEQQVLLSHVAGELQRIELLEDRSLAEIGLLATYRSRLAADVVTGKLDIQGMVKQVSSAMDETSDVFDEPIDDEEFDESAELVAEAGEIDP